MTDERMRAWFVRATRLSGGPDLVADVLRASFEDDVRALLPPISVPTLVLYREGDPYIRLGAGGYLAERIANARFVVLPGDDYQFCAGDSDTFVHEFEEFLTGARSGAEGDLLTMTILQSPRSVPSSAWPSPAQNTQFQSVPGCHKLLTRYRQ
jgi:hypothetical protein